MSTKNPTINVEMFDRVIDEVKHRPSKQFDMGVWATTIDEERPLTKSQDGEPLLCGTALCIGGWTCAVSGNRNDVKALQLEVLDFSALTPSLEKFQKTNKQSVAHRAIKRLGITVEVAEHLFFTSEWPTNIQARIERKTLTERAAALYLLRAIRDGKDPWAKDKKTGDYDPFPENIG